jgi:hypothetical protein
VVGFLFRLLDVGSKAREALLYRLSTGTGHPQGISGPNAIHIQGLKSNDLQLYQSNI